jgi:hypothetical protein
VRLQFKAPQAPAELQADVAEVQNGIKNRCAVELWLPANSHLTPAWSKAPAFPSAFSPSPSPTQNGEPSMWSLERGEHLDACPHLPCARSQKCFLRAAGRYCLKTHYANNCEFNNEMAAIINAINAEAIANGEPMIYGEAAAYQWRKTFTEMLATMEAEEARLGHSPS